MASNATSNTRQVWISNAAHAAAYKRKSVTRRDLRVEIEMAVAVGLGFEADPNDPDSSPLSELEKEYKAWLKDPSTSNRFAVDETAQARAKKRAEAKAALPKATEHKTKKRAVA